MIMVDGRKVPKYTALEFDARNRYYDEFLRNNPGKNPEDYGVPATCKAFRVVETATGKVVDDNNGYGYVRKAGAAVRFINKIKKEAAAREA